MSYQHITLSTGANASSPGPLPIWIADSAGSPGGVQALANIPTFGMPTEAVAQLGFEDIGFTYVADGPTVASVQATQSSQIQAECVAVIAKGYPSAGDHVQNAAAIQATIREAATLTALDAIDVAADGRC